MSENNQTEEMTLEETTEAIGKIKTLVKQTAEAKIEIGEILSECKRKIPHGGMESFYKSIKMSDRTAQYYMKIASNAEVQKLKTEGKLDGLNMQEILVQIGARVNVRGVNNDNAPQQVQEYVSVGFENFDISKRHTLREYKIEYEALSNKVSALEAELGTLRSPKVATGS